MSMRVGCGQVCDRKPIVRCDALGQLVRRGAGGHGNEVPGAREFGARVDAQFFSAGEFGRPSDSYQPMLNDRLEFHR